MIREGWDMCGLEAWEAAERMEQNRVGSAVAEPGSAAPARVIVCGSRRWNDRQLIADTLNALVLEHNWRFPEPVIVHGAAQGADRLAESEAGKAGLVTEAHPARWEQHGKRAGLIRNEEMAAEGAVLCVAFWDGKSTGTQHMMLCAERAGVPVMVVRKRTTDDRLVRSSPDSVGFEQLDAERVAKGLRP